MLTIHISGGLDMMEAAAMRGVEGTNIKYLVTALTSLSNGDSERIFEEIYVRR